MEAGFHAASSSGTVSAARAARIASNSIGGFISHELCRRIRLYQSMNRATSRRAACLVSKWRVAEQLPLQRREAALRRGVVEARPGPAHRLADPPASCRPCANRWRCIRCRGRSGRWCRRRHRRAPPRPSSSRRWRARRRDAPTARTRRSAREARSSTVAKYSLPSSVGTSVRSPHHLWLIAGAVKSRLTRSGTGGAALSGRVNQPRRVLVGRATRPWRAIDASTLFFDTRHPSSTRSASTRGDP